MNWILSILAYVVLGTIMAFALFFAISVPTVHRSWSTKRCIEVVPPTEDTCGRGSGSWMGAGIREGAGGGSG